MKKFTIAIAGNPNCGKTTKEKPLTVKVFVVTWIENGASVKRVRKTLEDAVTLVRQTAKLGITVELKSMDVPVEV